MQHWYETEPLRRAPHGGAIGVNEREYRGGEIMPFYVPRRLMPQVDDEQHAALIAFLTAMGHQVEPMSRKTLALHNHQRVKIDPEKLLHIDAERLAQPVIASEDGFVVDGNHRWFLRRRLAYQFTDTHTIMLPFNQAVEAVFKFPGTYTEDGEE